MSTKPPRQAFKGAFATIEAQLPSDGMDLTRHADHIDLRRGSNHSTFTRSGHVQVRDFRPPWSWRMPKQ